jgi:hypothetical protein
MKRFLPLIVTMAVGWIVLLTYFLPGLDGVRSPFVEVAIVIAAFGVVLGFINVFYVHATRIVRRRPGWFFSVVLLVSLVLVAAVSVAEGVMQGGLSLLNPASAQAVAQAGIAGVGMTGIYQYILIPIQSSLAALLPFLLAFAAYRTLRMRSTSGRAASGIFLVTAVIVLLGQVPLLNLPVVASLREWIIRVWAMGGVRGILLGVALGITATALRVLIGVDRPTSE